MLNPAAMWGQTFPVSPTLGPSDAIFHEPFPAFTIAIGATTRKRLHRLRQITATTVDGQPQPPLQPLQSLPSGSNRCKSSGRGGFALTLSLRLAPLSPAHIQTGSKISSTIRPHRWQPNKDHISPASEIGPRHPPPLGHRRSAPGRHLIQIGLSMSPPLRDPQPAPVRAQTAWPMATRQR